MIQRNLTKGPARRQAGFTLIEAIIYLGLLSIVMGGGLVSAFSMIEATGRTQTRLMIEQEGSFIIAKINWAVGGAQSINTPGNAQYSSTLSVNKIIGLDAAGLPIVSSVALSLPTAPGDLFIDDSLGHSALNNSNILVSRIGFYHTSTSGNGIDPESIIASTTLVARTPNGVLISEDFATTVYVRH